MKSKSQVSIFVIVGVIIIIVISFAIFINFNQKKISNDIDGDFLEVSNLKDSIAQCSVSALESSANMIAIQGGYYRGGAWGVEYEGAKIQKFMIRDEIKMPDMEIVESEFDEIFKEDISSCIWIFLDELNYSSYNLEFGENEYKFNNESISVHLDLHITADFLSGKAVSIRDVYVATENNFLKNFEIVKNFVYANHGNGYGVPVSFLTDYAYENSFNYEMIYGDNGLYIFFFIFDKSYKSMVIPFAIDYGLEV